MLVLIYKNNLDHLLIYLSLQIPDEPHFYCELFTFFEGINYICIINIIYYRRVTMDCSER